MKRRSAAMKHSAAAGGDYPRPRGAAIFVTSASSSPVRAHADAVPGRTASERSRRGALA